jgi:hypothetical protein
VGDEGEYTLRESFTEGKWSFGGLNSGSPEVVAAMERGEEKTERKEEEERARPNRYAPKGASLGGALLCPKGTSEGGTLLSTVAWPDCHVCTLGRHHSWCPTVHLRCHGPWHPTVGMK